MPISKRLIGAPAALVALALVGGACGSTSTDPDIASPVGPATDAVTDPSGSDSTEDAAGPESSADAGTDPAAGADGASEADGTGEEAATADHVFPDLETVNIADGSTLNLADELVGGDTPVLLWFWAPH